MFHRYILPLFALFFAALACHKPITTLPPVVGNNNTGRDSSHASNHVKPQPVDTVKPVRRLNWCDTIKEGQYKQIVVCYEKIGDGPVKADTVKILDTNPNAIYRPDRVDTPRSIVHKDLYKVAILMPFYTNRLRTGENAELDPNSLKSVEFYEGVKIALDTLSKEGLNLHVHVFDCRDGMERLEELLAREELQQADLIIGPVADDQLRRVVAFAEERNVPVVSPFNPKENIVEQSRCLIQVNPSYQVHCNRIVKFLESLKSKNPRVLVMGLAQDSARIEQLQQAYALMMNDENARLPQSISGKAGTSMKGVLSGSGLNIVIVPSYREETYIYNVLRELQGMYDKPAKGKNNENIIVIGMPQWKYFENVSIEYYENLNVHLTTEFFVDESLRENASFIRNYAALYGMPPREFGFVGFDLMLYFGRMLKKYGTAFPDYLTKEVDTRRHTIFSFEPVYKVRGQLDAKGNVINQPTIIRYENQYIQIVKFDEFTFWKAY